MCSRGIVVNDYMETSHPDIFAVGECTEHRGQVYGLVAPLLEQGKVLAATISGNRGPKFETAPVAAKLKIMGVDVFSAGSIDTAEPGTEAIRYEDPSLGVYKLLLLKENRLHGVILVGDATDSHRYMEWLRSGVDLASQRRCLLFPPPAADAGLDVARLPESDTVCGCMGVSKGAIVAGNPAARPQHARATEGSDAGQHRLRKLHRALLATPSRGGAGFPGRTTESAVRMRPVLAGETARHHPLAEIAICAGHP